MILFLVVDLDYEDLFQDVWSRMFQRSRVLLRVLLSIAAASDSSRAPRLLPASASCMQQKPGCTQSTLISPWSIIYKPSKPHHFNHHICAEHQNARASHYGGLLDKQPCGTPFGIQEGSLAHRSQSWHSVIM